MTRVSLSDLLPEAKFVSIGRGQVEVMSLDITHVGTLLGKYGSVLDGLFSAGGTPDFLAMVKDPTMPEVINDIIAMAIREVDQPEQVARIPLASKVEIMATVWELSVPDPKKLLAKLKELAEGATALRVEVGA